VVVQEEEGGVFTAVRAKAVAREGVGDAEAQACMAAAEDTVIVEVVLEMELEGTDAKET
jgi:hypothetical protein